jgi:hypothetical protein
MIALPFVAATLLAACTTTPVQVRVDQDASSNVTGYRTFGFNNQQATNTNGYQTLLTSHLQAASRAQLEGHGYVYTEENPELLVYFRVNLHRQQEIHAAPSGVAAFRAGYGGLGHYSVDTVSTKQGAVTIDVVDARNRTVVWQGVGEGVVSPKAEKNASESIDKALTEVFREFPSRNSR